MDKKEYHREWRKKNREKLKKYRKEWISKPQNKTKHNEGVMKWYNGKKKDLSWVERMKEYRRIYWSKNGRKYLDKREKGWKLRFIVLKRDNFTCQYCGRKAPQVELHIDHIIPTSKGGDSKIENLRTACLECNVGRGNALF